MRKSRERKHNERGTTSGADFYFVALSFPYGLFLLACLSIYMCDSVSPHFAIYLSSGSLCSAYFWLILELNHHSQCRVAGRRNHRSGRSGNSLYLFTFELDPFLRNDQACFRSTVVSEGFFAFRRSTQILERSTPQVSLSKHTHLIFPSYVKINSAKIFYASFVLLLTLPCRLNNVGRLVGIVP